MMQTNSQGSERRVPPWVAIAVLLVLVGGVAAGLWYFIGSGSKPAMVTDPSFEPGGVMTREWLRDPNSSGIRRTDAEKPDQWRIKSGQIWVDAARVGGKLRFETGNRGGRWGRGGGSLATPDQNDVLRMATQIARSPGSYSHLNLTRQQLDTLRGISNWSPTDIPPDVQAALTDVWPKFEKASGRAKEQAEEQIVQIASEVTQKQKQVIASKVDLIQRTLTTEQIAQYKRPATKPAAPPPPPPATMPATTLPTSAPATPPATTQAG